MTATALTAEAAGSDLLDELLAVLVRHDGAATTDEVRQLADDVTAVVRRARGKLRQLTRRAAKPSEMKPSAASEATAKPAEPAEPAIAANPTSPAVPPPEPAPAPATRLTIAEQDRTPSPATPASISTAGVPAATARRVSTIRYIITAVAVVASALSDSVGRATTRALHAIRPRLQRVVPFAAEHDDETDEACIVCGPEYGCCSPITSRIGRIAVRLARSLR